MRTIGAVAGSKRGRSLRRGAIVALAILASATGAASAATLPFTGSFAISLAGLGVGLPGAGAAEVDGLGHLGAWSVGEGAFATAGLVVPITTSAAAPIGGIQVTARNASGHFQRGSSGEMAILGAAKVCVFGPCSSAVANLIVPLSVVGAGGTATVEGAINVTVIGAPWTTGTASIGTVTAVGWARGPNGLTSSTALPSGEIQLVTPIRIFTNLANDYASISAFGVLSLHFVPEPTTLALVGGGLAAAAAFGRRKQRRS